MFNLFTALRSEGHTLINEMQVEDELMAHRYPETTWMTRADIDPDAGTLSRNPYVSFFTNPSAIAVDDSARLLLKKTGIKTESIQEISTSHHLPDLLDLMAKYVDCPKESFHSARWNVWDSVRLQRRSTQHERLLLPPVTIQARAPDKDMAFGRCNTVLIAHANGSILPGLGSESMSAVIIFSHPYPETDEHNSIEYIACQMRCILAANTKDLSLKGLTEPLIYVEKFDWVEYERDANGTKLIKEANNIGMVRIIRSKGKGGFDGNREAFITPLKNIRHFAELMPEFGAKADDRLTSENSVEILDSYYINKFADREPLLTTSHTL